MYLLYIPSLQAFKMDQHNRFRIPLTQVWWKDLLFLRHKKFKQTDGLKLSTIHATGDAGLAG